MRCHRLADILTLSWLLIILQINFQIGNFLLICTKTHTSSSQTHKYIHQYKHAANELPVNGCHNEFLFQAHQKLLLLMLLL